MEYTVLVLDPATSTGYCLVKINTTDKTADIFKVDFIDVDVESEYIGDNCISLMEQITEIIDLHKVEDVGIEAFFFSKKRCNGCDVNSAYRTALHILCRQKSLPYTILGITEWKKFVSGDRCTPTPKQKKLWGKAAKKLFIQDALWKRFGFRFPNHSLSKKTNKPIKFRTDIVDVVAMAIYFCLKIKNIKKITLSHKFPNDVPMKGKMLQGYKYDEEGEGKKDKISEQNKEN